MSYVARLLRAEGHEVIGADAVENSTVLELKNEGIPIFIGHKSTNIPKETELVLLSPAVLSSQPEDYLYAKAEGIETKTWQEYIGELTKKKRTIAICGAHGKSTTTAMVGLMLMEAGYDPTVLIGTKLKEFGGSNIRFGASDWLVIEADEFHENFLNYYPEHILVTSFEPDHLEYYKNEKNYREAFVKFFRQLSQNPVGHIYYHGTNPEPDTLVLQATMVDGEHMPIEAITHISEIPESMIPPLQVSGMYNRENACLVYALGRAIGIPDDTIESALKKFQGTWRRQEYKGKCSEGAEVYDDYGHHPTEVAVTLEGMKARAPHKKLLCVFQPHQYSRTRIFFEEFKKAFSAADSVLIADIYASRDTEEDKKSINAQNLVDGIKEYHESVYLGGSIEECYKKIQESEDWKGEEWMIVTMGAGDVTNISDWLVQK